MSQNSTIIPHKEKSAQEGTQSIISQPIFESSQAEKLYVIKPLETHRIILTQLPIQTNTNSDCSHKKNQGLVRVVDYSEQRFETI